MFIRSNSPHPNEINGVFSATHLSNTLERDAQKSPLEYSFSGIVVYAYKELSRAALSLAYRVQALWETGKWITLESATQDFKQQVDYLDRSARSGYVSNTQLFLFKNQFQNVGQIKKILEKAGANHEGLSSESEKIQQLGILLQTIEKINSASQDKLQTYVNEWDKNDLKNISDAQLQSISVFPLKKLDVLLAPFGLSRVSALTQPQLQALLKHLSDNHLANISKDQFKELNLSGTDAALLNRLLTKERVAILSSTQLESILPEMDQQLFDNLKQVLIKHKYDLDLSHLSIEFLPEVIQPRDVPDLQSHRLLELLPRLVTLTDNRQDFLSPILESQWQQLNLESLPAETLSAVLSNERIALFSNEQLQPILGCLDSETLIKISPGRLARLDCSAVAPHCCNAYVNKLSEKNSLLNSFSDLPINFIQAHLNSHSLNDDFLLLLPLLSDERLKELSLNEISTELSFNLLCFYDDKNVINRLSPEQLSSNSSSLSPFALRLISNEQFVHLNLLDEELGCKKASLDYLFGLDCDYKLQDCSMWEQNTRFRSNIGPEPAKSHFESLNPETFVVLFPKLDPACLQHMTPEQARSIDYSQHPDLIKTLSQDHLNAVLDKLEGDLIRKISNDQLSMLDVDRLTPDQIDDLFTPSKQPGYWQTASSQEEQERCDENRKLCMKNVIERLNVLKQEAVQTILPHLNSNAMRMINRNMVGNLDLNDLTDDQLICLLKPYVDDLFNGKPVKLNNSLAPLSSQQIQELLPRMLGICSGLQLPEEWGRYSAILKQIDGKLAELDLSELTEDELKTLYPYENKKALKKTKERFAELSEQQFKSIQDKIDLIGLETLMSPVQKELRSQIESDFASTGNRTATNTPAPTPTKFSDDESDDESKENFT